MKLLAVFHSAFSIRNSEFKIFRIST